MMIRDIDKRIVKKEFHTGYEVETVTIQESDFEYLKEQAKRAEELEEDNESLQVLSKINRKEHMIIHEQNKRYREYLELIRITGTHGKDIKTGEIIRSDEANLADEALEGDLE